MLEPPANQNYEKSNNREYHPQSIDINIQGNAPLRREIPAETLELGTPILANDHINQENNDLLNLMHKSSFI
jgi:hypothetical protein